MRRIIKPFTVEHRSSSRRKTSPFMLAEEEQPRVEWPAAMLEELRPEPALAPAEPPRRVLPALDEQPKPVPAAEPARRAEPEPEPEPDFERPPARPEPEMPVPAEPEAAAAEPVPEPRAPRPPRARPARGDFALGERWKARLPVSVHTPGARRGRFR